MVNRYEHRLRQIEILIRAYKQEDSSTYREQIRKLEDERLSILNDINFKD